MGIEFERRLQNTSNTTREISGEFIGTTTLENNLAVSPSFFILNPDFGAIGQDPGTWIFRSCQWSFHNICQVVLWFQKSTPARLEVPVSKFNLREKRWEETRVFHCSDPIQAGKPFHFSRWKTIVSESRMITIFQDNEFPTTCLHLETKTLKLK